MANNGKMGVVAEVIPPVSRRAMNFAHAALSQAIEKLSDSEIIELGKQHGLVKVMTCTEENKEHWQHLPVNLGDQVYQFVEGLE